MKTSYTTSELAREFDVTPRTVRFYEDIGLLQPKVEGARKLRLYSARDRTRLKLILRAKRLGLKLSEARELVEMFESPKDTKPQLSKYVQVLEQHRHDLEQRLVDLKENVQEVLEAEREAEQLLAALQRPPSPKPRVHQSAALRRR